MVLPNDVDLLNPPAELEKRKHKLKRLVQSPNSFFMVKTFPLTLSARDASTFEVNSEFGADEVERVLVDSMYAFIFMQLKKFLPRFLHFDDNKIQLYEYWVYYSTFFFGCLGMLCLVYLLNNCVGFYVNRTTVFSHSQTVVVCGNCQTVLCQPTGGRARLTEGCSFRKKGD
ncbi:hypothetical protein RJ639_004697 [Escallonia herrerae]|uniref:40S ribosomal protein S27 n=1 Tax=Escallonia herrerae TaxID=1293975 RepID=A0AA89AX80_9ASTE|nr:hypothetical protein RJ639_004697 [Escallonia herrerae]